MRYFDYLKKGLPVYLLSGTVLAISVFLMIAVQNYNTHLNTVLGDMNTISINKVRVKKQAGEFDALVEYFRGAYHLDMQDVKSEAVILRTLDKLKADLQDAAIRVGDFSEKGGRRELPVEIEAPVTSYKMVLDYIGYTENLRIPDFRINHLSIIKVEAGKVVLNVKGALVMPS